MKELKTLSLSITRPLEESSLLMVLGGGGGGTNPPDKSKNADICEATYSGCVVNTGNCSYCSNCSDCSA